MLKLKHPSVQRHPLPNLRTHATKDTVIGAISQQSLEHVARILELHAKRLKNPFLKWLYKDRHDAVTIEMIAAAFSRVKGVQEAMPAQFDAQVKIAFERDQK